MYAVVRPPFILNPAEAPASAVSSSVLISTKSGEPGGGGGPPRCGGGAMARGGAVPGRVRCGALRSRMAWAVARSSMLRYWG